MDGVPPPANAAERRSFVTAAEVARRAGVSRSAVSRTFTPGTNVSDAMRMRVTQAAEQLGYRVNRLAQSLISARSNLVGVVATTIEMPFHASLLSRLSQALLADGFHCMLLNAANAERDMSALVAQILEYRVAAIVVMSGQPPSLIVEESLRNGVPVILVNKPMRGLAVDTVLTDHAAAGRDAADLLIGAGCRQLAVVSGEERTASLRGRLEAFVGRARALGFSVTVREQGLATYGTGRAAGLDLLAGRRIDGAFCVTDALALGFVDAARETRCRVPDDLSVIGFDDIPQASWSAYRLSTFHQSVERLAEAVMAILRRRRQDAAVPPQTVTITANFVSRSTLRTVGEAERIAS